MIRGPSLPLPDLTAEERADVGWPEGKPVANGTIFFVTEDGPTAGGPETDGSYRIESKAGDTVANSSDKIENGATWNVIGQEPIAETRPEKSQERFTGIVQNGPQIAGCYLVQRSTKHGQARLGERVIG